jgi:hypothetical protein
MIKTFKDFHTLKFPLYVLPSEDWYVIDRVLFINEQIVDERNMPGETLGLRRLQCGRKDLLPLTKAILSIPDLTHCRTKFFIDNAGKPFIYQKTISSKLKTYRIKRVDQKETASVMWLYDWPAPITVPRPPEAEYVRMLHYQKAPWIVYDYVRQPVKDTYRRV